MAVSLYSGIAAAIAVGFLLLRQITWAWSFPSAPGPWLASFTKWWMIKKLWAGHFEKWEIKQHAENGPVIRIAPDIYSIDDPEALDIIYGASSNMPKADWYEVWGTPGHANDNLFSATNLKFHNQMRRRVQHLYNMSAVKEYEPDIEHCIQLLIEQWDKLAASGQSFNLQRWMQFYAFDVLSRLNVSSTVGFLETGGTDVDGIIGTLESMSKLRTVFGFELNLKPLLFWKYGDPHKYMRGWIKKLRQERIEREDDIGSKGSIDFHTRLKAISDADPKQAQIYKVNNAMNDNVAAGSESPSTSLSAILFYIYKHPNVLKKLRAEINDAARIGKVSDPITYDECIELPYFQQVMTEGLRLYPAIGLPLWRVVQEPGVQISGKHFPAGTTVGINTFVAHRNQDVYGSDIEVFRPERWDPAVTPADQLAAMQRYYFPFGAGARTCIGEHIGLLELHKLVVELVRRYDLNVLADQMTTHNAWFVKQKGLMAKVSKIQA